MIKPAGFRELAHTADWELEAWAPDLTGLFEQAAFGMYKISGTRLQIGERYTRMVELHALDAESLLVRFLTELLWLGQEDGLAFDRFMFNLMPGWTLEVKLSGAAIASVEKEIKAVTYHNLVIRRTARGLAVNIVFDV